MVEREKYGPDIARSIPNLAFRFFLSVALCSIYIYDFTAIFIWMKLPHFPKTYDNIQNNLFDCDCINNFSPLFWGDKLIQITIFTSRASAKEI